MLGFHGDVFRHNELHDIASLVIEKYGCGDHLDPHFIERMKAALEEIGLKWHSICRGHDDIESGCDHCAIGMWGIKFMPIAAEG